MLFPAVHPEHKNLGIGTELNTTGLEGMKAASMVMADVGAGGDESHARARRSYENACYIVLPLVRSYKHLEATKEVAEQLCAQNIVTESLMPVFAIPPWTGSSGSRLFLATLF